MNNILNLTEEELKNFMKENEEKSFRATQVYQWIYKGIHNFDNMSNLSQSTKRLLNDNFYVEVPDIIIKQESEKKDTVKYLLKYKDGNMIECVLMKYAHGNSLCVSTQVGCNMGCKFCASTIDGKVRNLTDGEMLGEILAVQKDLNVKISHVVLMGSGEPLDNYDNVIRFIKRINDKNGFNIGQRHITLSTCGIVPKIKDLADENLQITLAISLHATNDEKRKQIMPITNKYGIKEILNACIYYIKKTGRRISFEYSLVKGVNDKEEDAENLSKLLKDILCHVNLIPINEIKERNFKKSNNAERFLKILEKNNIPVTIRREMGSDIDAACGQLRRKYKINKD